MQVLHRGQFIQLLDSYSRQPRGSIADNSPGCQVRAHLHSTISSSGRRRTVRYRRVSNESQNTFSLYVP